MQGEREECIAAGMDDYLSKPFTPDQLRSMLEKWLTGEDECASDRAPRSNGAEALSEPTVRDARAKEDLIDKTALATIRTLQPGSSR